MNSSNFVSLALGVCVLGYTQIHYQSLERFYIYYTKLLHVSTIYPGLLQGATSLVDMQRVRDDSQAIYI